MSAYGCKGLTRSYDVTGLSWGAAVAWALARVSEGKRDDVAVYHVPSDAIMLSIARRDGLCVVCDADGEVVIGERKGGTPKPQKVAPSPEHPWWRTLSVKPKVEPVAAVDKPAPVVKCRNCGEPAGHDEIHPADVSHGPCCGDTETCCSVGRIGGWTARPLVTP